MLHFLITLETRDGEHEYWDRWIFECEEGEEPSDLDIIKEFTGLDDFSPVYSSWYECEHSLRHYQVRERQEVAGEALVVLKQYGF